MFLKVEIEAYGSTEIRGFKNHGLQGLKPLPGFWNRDQPNWQSLAPYYKSLHLYEQPQM